MIRTLALGTALAAMAAMPSFAKDVTILNFAGHIEIVPGDSGVSVLRSGTKGGLDYSDGNAIVIDGGLSDKALSEACKGVGISFDLDWNGEERRGDTRLGDYPKVRIAVPEGSELKVENSNLRLDSDVDFDAADLDLSGCFDTSLADIGTLGLDKSGSGEFSAKTVGRLIGDKSGSGEVILEAVDYIEFEQSGSGDLEIGLVTGRADIEKSGSGDVEIDRMEANLTLEKSGSGDVEIRTGEIPNLSVENSGSGDVEIDAAVGNAEVRASGSGDVYVESISGSQEVHTSGSGDFKRGDR